MVKRSRVPGFVLSFLCLAAVAPSFASRQSDYEAFDRKIHDELRTIAPDLEPVFREADEARAAGDHRRAATLYAQVVEKAPGFVHARRRLGTEQAALGENAQAIATLEQAVALVASAENLTALAMVLVSDSADSTGRVADAQRAEQLVNRALALDPGQLNAHLVRAGLALQRGDLGALDSSVAALNTLDPDEVASHYYGAIAAAMHGDFRRARATLDRARAAGMPEADYHALRASIDAAEPLGPRILAWGGIIAGIWLACGIALLLAGLGLSALTLRSSESVPADPEVGATGLDAALRHAYRVVLWLCCAYYYVSMPILLGLVLVVGGALIYGLLAVGHTPVKLLLIVGLVTLVTAWSILRSLLVRVKEVDPGVRLDLQQEPALRRTLEDVAARVGTRPVDAVFLTPMTEVAVFERGGMLRQLRGSTERCLILGAGALEGLRMGPFRAVLAHEYGHFSNRDTAGGGFALAVRRSVVALAVRLAQSGAAGWYNPAWLFVNGFHRMFLRISQGASRLQEVLADRWAAVLYGAQAFEDGLRHIIARAVHFEAHVNATLQEVVEAKRPLANLYRYSPEKATETGEGEASVREVIEREPSPYDSHPRPADRFRWVHALGVQVQPAPDEDAPVWDLFASRAAIEELMTRQVRMAIAENHGIQIESGA